MPGMVDIAPFRPEHLSAMRLQGAQAQAQGLMNPAHGHDLVQGDTPRVAYTALVDGRPIACAGVVEIWQGRAYAWSYLSDEAKRHFKAVHRAVLMFLDTSAECWPRVEMAVDVGHGAAKRWAAHLGFERECVARKWTADGRDVEIWARVI